MSDDSDSAWWKTLGFGLLFLGITWFLYYYFSDFEANGGRRRIHWAIAGMYNLGGKWLVCSVTGVIGLALTAMGVKEFRER